MIYYGVIFWLELYLIDFVSKWREIVVNCMCYKGISFFLKGFFGFWLLVISVRM